MSDEELRVLQEIREHNDRVIQRAMEEAMEEVKRKNALSFDRETPTFDFTDLYGLEE